MAYLSLKNVSKIIKHQPVLHEINLDVEKGEIVVRPIMTLSLTYDHRVIDGAPAAEFLQYIKTLLQNPYLMM